jgi:hypothetical protein
MSLGLGEIEQTNRRGAVGEIGLDRHRVAAVLANDIEYLLRISGTIVAIRIWYAGIDSVSESQVRDQHTHTTSREASRNRGADTMIPTGYQRDVIAHLWSSNQAGVSRARSLACPRRSTPHAAADENRRSSMHSP